MPNTRPSTAPAEALMVRMKDAQLDWICSAAIFTLFICLLRIEYLPGVPVTLVSSKPKKEKSQVPRDEGEWIESLV